MNGDGWPLNFEWRRGVWIADKCCCAGYPRSKIVFLHLSSTSSKLQKPYDLIRPRANGYPRIPRAEKACSPIGWMPMGLDGKEVEGTSIEVWMAVKVGVRSALYLLPYRYPFSYQPWTMHRWTFADPLIDPNSLPALAYHYLFSFQEPIVAGYHRIVRAHISPVFHSTYLFCCLDIRQPPIGPVPVYFPRHWSSCASSIHRPYQSNFAPCQTPAFSTSLLAHSMSSTVAWGLKKRVELDFGVVVLCSTCLKQCIGWHGGL